MVGDRYFPLFDGMELYMERDLANVPKALVMIVYGIHDHQNHYDCVTEKLNAAGYSVYRFGHRGHGVDDLTEAIKIAEAENPGLPLFIWNTASVSA